MPEAAVNKHCDFLASEYEIRTSRNLGVPAPATQFSCTKQSGQQNFGGLIAPSANPAHQRRSLEGRHHIGHA